MCLLVDKVDLVVVAQEDFSRDVDNEQGRHQAGLAFLGHAQDDPVVKR